MWGANAAQSKRGRPAKSPCQVASQPSPSAETIPTPVIQASRPSFIAAFHRSAPGASLHPTARSCLAMARRAVTSVTPLAFWAGLSQVRPRPTEFDPGCTDAGDRLRERMCRTELRPGRIRRAPAPCAAPAQGRSSGRHLRYPAAVSIRGAAWRRGARSARAHGANCRPRRTAAAVPDAGSPTRRSHFAWQEGLRDRHAALSPRADFEAPSPPPVPSPAPQALARNGDPQSRASCRRHLPLARATESSL